MNSRSKCDRKREFTSWGVLFFSCWFIALILITSGAQPKKTLQSIQSVTVESIQLDQVDMGEALKQLRSKSKGQILIGFEEIPHVESQLDKPISTDISDGASVETVLNRLVAADTRYTYEVTSDSIINVFPYGSKTDPTNLLNMRISKFSVHRDIFPETLTRRIGEYTPELRNYLKKKAQEHAAKSGLYTGTPGSTVGGIGRQPKIPRIDLEMQNVTVREILNAVALYSVKLSRDPSLNPFGWKYEFIIDRDAYTGLGGYPRWSEF